VHVATVFALSLASSAAGAQAGVGSVTNSPIAIGNNTNQEVYYNQSVQSYDQRTQNYVTSVKHVVIYHGPKFAEVLAALQTIVDQQQATLVAAQHDERAMFTTILELLLKRFDAESDIESSIRETSAPVLRQLIEIKDDVEAIEGELHRGPPRWFFGASGGFIGISPHEGAFASGGYGRIDALLGLSEGETWQHMLGVSVACDIVERQQLTLAPSGRALEHDDVGSMQISLQPEYEAWWLLAKNWHLAFRGGFFAGGLRIQSQGSSNWSAAFGPQVGVEAATGWAEDFMLRLGLELAYQNSTAPVLAFRGLEPDSARHREWQPVVRAYVGVLIGR
jgi:hypothetical protein